MSPRRTRGFGQPHPGTWRLLFLAPFVLECLVGRPVRGGVSAQRNQKADSSSPCGEIAALIRLNGRSVIESDVDHTLLCSLPYRCQVSPVLGTVPVRPVSAPLALRLWLVR